MATIRGKNFAWKNLSEHIQPGDTVIDCNCVQKTAGTSLPDAEYVDCNLMNCDVGALGIAPVGGLTAQKSLCYWLHPDIGLDVEPEDCPHVVTTYEADVDGETVVNYVREDTVL